MGILNITEAEYETLSRQNPALARQLVQTVLGMRGGQSPGDPPTAEEWDDPWAALLTLADAYKDRPPTRYLVEGLLPLPSVTMIYGSPGCLKSMLLMDLALSVASGHYWLEPSAPGDPSGRRVEQAPVLWVDLDQGEEVMAERLAALGRGHLAPRDCPNLFWKSLPGGGLNLLEKLHVGDMLMRMRKTGAKLVCIDNLGQAKGMADENSAEMIQVLNGLRYLAESGEAAVVVLHHARKETGFKSRAGDLVRGHSSITAALDLALAIERQEQAAEISVRIGKNRRHPIRPFKASFQVENAPGSMDMRWARFYSGLAQVSPNPLVEARAAEHDEEIEAIDEAIVDCVQGGALTQSRLVQAVRERLPLAGINLIRGRVDRLARQGLLRAERGQHNRQLYSPGEGVEQNQDEEDED
jgi:hypothetical protein